MAGTNYQVLETSVSPDEKTKVWMAPISHFNTSGRPLAIGANGVQEQREFTKLGHSGNRVSSTSRNWVTEEPA